MNAIRIENHCASRVPFDIERLIGRLLKRVPPEHLVGLSAIVLVDRATDARHPKAAGLYSPQSGQRPAAIELALTAIYGNVPRVFLLLPFVPRFMLAGAL